MTGRAMEDPKSIQRRFEAAVKVIRSVPEDGSYDLSDDMLVMFYSYYKQATAGPCNTPKPNSWDPIGKAKWEAWKILGNMSKDQAMVEYVQEIQQIIETLPVTDRMAELMDALDPFYEMVAEDDDDEDDAFSKAAPLSTGNTNGEKTDDDDAAEKLKAGESEINGENKKDELEMEKRRKDSSTFAAGRGGSSVFNESEENSMSSSTDDAHSSLNTGEEEEELTYDDSDDEMYSDSMENPATQEKGSGVPRVHLADVSVAGARMQQGGNREPQCGSQDGKPQEATLPVPHPPTLGPVRTDRISAGSGRGWARAEILALKTQHSKSPKKRLPWWPLNMSPITVALTVIWPFAVHWLLQFYLQKTRRRLRVK
ncbi:acyl-CoA-binding domain-containing protein 5-B [Sinocyclocheilus grahami]|uniref:acyl-CoA-binding domain-containing protein 5-B n=1 Tax=Sinocyclocheilus grahami TaxID=75366 RepID=UPI0007AD418F|nr:PREDICTED: acyl-CoA-binding domain-containing protein 5-B-like [Sinocyclocheilus grahami]